MKTLFAGFLLALSGCCVAESCECADERADTVFLRFSRDSLSAGGFRAADLDTFRLVRITLDSAYRPLRDTVGLEARVGTEGADFVLDQRRPFASNPRKAGAYSYEVQGIAPDTFTVRLSAVQVSGHLRAATACCTCYENLRKELRVNGGPLLNLHTAAATDQPVVVELRKP